MIVDPLEAIIGAMKAHAALNSITGGRIDDRHHYGQESGDWAQNARGLTVGFIGGAADLYLPTQKTQLEARCYGDTYYEAGKVYRELVAFCRNTRQRVTVTEGLALIYYCVIRGQPRRFMDDEIRPNGGMPCYLLQMEADVAEETVLS